MQRLKLISAQKTDRGQVRDHNEDAIWPPADRIPPEDQHSNTLFIVADGMGGHRAGDVASRLAVETITAIYEQSQAAANDCLEEAIQQANRLIYQENSNAAEGKMGTTVVCAAVENDRLCLANVGDSRAYLIRDGQIQQLTQDHTFVGELMQAGVLSSQEAEIHPKRHVVTRGLGKASEVEPYLYREPLHPDDILVLCSDGLHGPVQEHEIKAIASRNSPHDAVEQLVKLANDRGGKDNISVITIKATLEQADKTTITSSVRRRLFGFIGLIALVILAGAAIAGILNRVNFNSSEKMTSDGDAVQPQSLTTEEISSQPEPANTQVARPTSPPAVKSMSEQVNLELITSSTEANVESVATTGTSVNNTITLSPTVNITPSAAATIIPTSVFKYQAPTLLEPANESIVPGRFEAQLKWEPVGPLAENESYAVRLIYVKDRKDIYQGHQVKVPEWQVPEEFYGQTDDLTLLYRWFVFVERKNADGSTTQLSPHSEIFSFHWH